MRRLYTFAIFRVQGMPKADYLSCTRRFLGGERTMRVITRQYIRLLLMAALACAAGSLVCARPEAQQDGETYIWTLQSKKGEVSRSRSQMTLILNLPNAVGLTMEITATTL